MVKYEPPYVVHLMEDARAHLSAEKGVVYSSGSPEEAEAFASDLCDAGGAVVEVRDSRGQLVRRFSTGSLQPTSGRNGDEVRPKS
jgi:hypothetical protein